MPAPKLAVLQAKGQITIPAEIRRKLGLKTGDRVAFVETDQGVLIRPQKTAAMETLDKLGEMLQDKGISLGELLDSSREIRVDFASEEHEDDDAPE